MRCCLVLAILFGTAVHAQVKPSGGEVVSPELDASIARGLAYLARQQQGDGSFQNRELNAAAAGDHPRFAGHEVASGDSDLSVSGWCILALRAAQNAGVEVPKDSADRAAGFVLKCWRPDGKGFAYQAGGEATLTMTAAALLDLQLLDRAARPE